MARTENIYVKGEEAVLVNEGKLFIYEVAVYCHYKNYFGLINKVQYSSTKEIANIVSHFKRDSHTEICCDLFSAPLNWLLENDFIKYVKPDKKIIVKTIKKKKDGKSKTTIGKSRSWIPNG